MPFFGVTWASRDREPMLLEAESMEKALVTLHAWPDALNTTCLDYAPRRQLQFHRTSGRTRMADVYRMNKDPYPNHDGFVVKAASRDWNEWPPEVEWVIQVYDGYIE